MRILVLGGYGLIGLAISKRLLRDGHDLVGLGRSARKGRALLPDTDWISVDIATLTRPEDWHSFVDGIDVVINAAGALQDGLKDKVIAVQQHAMLALIRACETAGVNRFVQISAPGVDAAASTAFYRSKAVADQALRNSALDWTIFRPGLVWSPHAYGGTALVRLLAAFPLIQPIVMADRPVQTVAIDDVADAIACAVDGKLVGEDLDLVEPEVHTLAEHVVQVRAWLGFAQPHAILKLPGWLGRATARLGDAAGWLGWRSALRTTSLEVMTNGVMGNPDDWARVADHPARTLEQTLARLPSTAQERIFARAMLVFPLALVVLAGFWITSGLVGLAQHDRAVATLSAQFSNHMSGLFVRAGSVIDILIGLALIFRPTVRAACAASVLVSIGYLAASALFTPDLWSDPLGSMVKVFPAIALALVIAALAEER